MKLAALVLVFLLLVAAPMIAAYALAGCGAAAQAAEDPRVVADFDRLTSCRELGRAAFEDGGDAGAGWGAYCACTVDAGMRSSCPKVAP